ncbi:MAG TPA: DUF559 domain-containing protein, partial [Pyrinomonadaceae bacterium]|nr:DUF559 domain-containing protein [Pyrinomonadaceae bacterium]
SASTPPLEGGEFLNLDSRNLDSGSQTQFETKNSPPILGGVDALRGRGGKRLQIYLTNSLEEHHPDTGTLWASWLSAEANEANHIKRDTPVMCVIGNPPYSGESQNKGKWIMDLMEDYKKEPDTNEKLKEQNSKFINDDYVKFLRYGQHFIENNGEGILAFINPHGFLDNPTFRGMRWHLLKTYDKIYTIDLHGNSKKKETAPDGSADVNVFDIMQGVSINIFVKTGKKKANELGKVFHFDLYGKRNSKYDFLIENSLTTVPYKELPNVAPEYLFKFVDETMQKDYKKGINPTELFKINVMGFQTHRDHFCIDENKEQLVNNLIEFSRNESSEDIISKIFEVKSSSDFDIKKVQAGLVKLDLREEVIKCSYRPFENKYILFDRLVVDRPRKELILHSKNKDNLLLGIGRQGMAVGDIDWCLTTVSKHPVDANIFRRGGVNLFPLYLYPETGEQGDMFATTPSAEAAATPPLEGGELKRIPNLNMEIVKQFADKIGLTFTPEKIETTQQNSPPFEGGVDALRGRGGNSQINNLPYLKTFRKELRNNLTPAEARFWTIIKNKQFEGRKFRRQHSVGNYILDFYCPSERLAIELDGQVHFNDTAQEYDYERKLFLEHYGIKVLRFENKLVFEELEWMLGVIKSNFGWSVKAEPPRPRSADTPPLEGGESDNKNSPPSKGGVRGGFFAPIDILDYIYAVLHSPSYREKYKEFLKIDFPRVPFPKDAETFWKLVELGKEIREIHLLESAKVSEYITQYPVDGTNTVGKVHYEPLRPADTSPFKGEELKGKVWINETQYFDNVPETAWNFYIGGYQPAQKWLKDRKERTLDYEDIFHYQKIIVALTETDRLMKEIDEIAVD